MRALFVASSLMFLNACDQDADADTSVVDERHSALELETHELLNDHRESIGLNPLELNADVSDVARVHSADMDDGSVPFSHDGAEDRAAEILTFLDYKVFGENVAFNQFYDDPAAIAVEGWLNSQGHRENIEGDYDVTGMGIVGDDDRGYYFTQLFLKL